jgi:Mn-dependent DtxR family transcriptional regulator
VIPIPCLLKSIRDNAFTTANQATLAAGLGCSRFEVRQAIDRASYQRLLVIKPDGKIVLTSSGLGMVGRRRVVRVLP